MSKIDMRYLLSPKEWLKAFKREPEAIVFYTVLFAIGLFAWFQVKNMGDSVNPVPYDSQDTLFIVFALVILCVALFSFCAGWMAAKWDEEEVSSKEDRLQD